MTRLRLRGVCSVAIVVLVGFPTLSDAQGNQPGQDRAPTPVTISAQDVLDYQCWLGVNKPSDPRARAPGSVCDDSLSVPCEGGGTGKVVAKCKEEVCKAATYCGQELPPNTSVDDILKRVQSGPQSPVSGGAGGGGLQQPVNTPNAPVSGGGSLDGGSNNVLDNAYGGNTADMPSSGNTQQPAGTPAPEEPRSVLEQVVDWFRGGNDPAAPAPDRSVWQNTGDVFGNPLDNSYEAAPGQNIPANPTDISDSPIRYYNPPTTFVDFSNPVSPTETFNTSQTQPTTFFGAVTGYFNNLFSGFFGGGVQPAPNVSTMGGFEQSAGNTNVLTPGNPLGQNTGDISPNDAASIGDSPAVPTPSETPDTLAPAPAPDQTGPSGNANPGNDSPSGGNAGGNASGSNGGATEYRNPGSDSGTMPSAGVGGSSPFVNSPFGDYLRAAQIPGLTPDSPAYRIRNDMVNGGSLGQDPKQEEVRDGSGGVGRSTDPLARFETANFRDAFARYLSISEDRETTLVSDRPVPDAADRVLSDIAAGNTSVPVQVPTSVSAGDPMKPSPTSPGVRFVEPPAGPNPFVPQGVSTQDLSAADIQWSEMQLLTSEQIAELRERLGPAESVTTKIDVKPKPLQATVSNLSPGQIFFRTTAQHLNPASKFFAPSDKVLDLSTIYAFSGILVSPAAPAKVFASYMVETARAGVVAAAAAAVPESRTRPPSGRRENGERSMAELVRPERALGMFIQLLPLGLQLMSSLMNGSGGADGNPLPAQNQATASQPVVPSVTPFISFYAIPGEVGPKRTTRLVWNSVGTRGCIVRGPLNEILHSGLPTGQITSPEIEIDTVFRLSCATLDGKLMGTTTRVTMNESSTASGRVQGSAGTTSASTQPSPQVVAPVPTNTPTGQSSSPSNTVPAKGVADICDPGLGIDAYILCLERNNIQGPVIR